MPGFATDLVIAACRSIGPLSITALLYRLFALFTRRKQIFWDNSLLKRVVNGWLLVEALFYLYCRVLNASMQRQPPEKRVVRLSRKERLDLFQSCLQCIQSPCAFYLSWYSTVHKFEELRKENVEEWLAWGLFHRHSHADVKPEEKQQLDELVAMFEQAVRTEKTDYRLLPGRLDSARLMKFSSAPVTYVHRPFIIYFLLHHLLQETVTPCRMWWLGFSRAVSGELSFFIRLGSVTKEPLIVIHGLGVGCLPYDAFLRQLVQRTQTPGSSLFGRSIICLELQAISQRMAPPELHRDSFVADVRSLLRHFGFKKGGIVCGHSYGSFPLCWLVRCAPDLVAGVALLDAACLFLHLPKVMFSILYEEPADALGRITHYFIRAELWINHHFRRHFFWYANVLFLEDFDTRTKPTLVVVSANDAMLPVQPVENYVRKYNQARGSSDGQNAEVDLLCLQTTHGGFLFCEKYLEQVVMGVERLASKLDTHS